MNLNIIVDAVRAHTSDDFLIRDVPGTSGRLDVICRILVSAYRTVPELSPFVQVNAVLGGLPNPSLRVRVQNVSAGEFPKSELECALLLKGLLYRYRTMEMARNLNWPQFTIEAASFENTLEETSQDRDQILYLVEEGQPLAEVDLKLDQPIVIILGDDKGLSASHEKAVLGKPVQKVRIGTRSLLGSQVVSLFLLDLKQRIEKQSSMRT